jgi:hypothetical protein
MELQQFVALVAHAQRAAGRQIDLHGVAVVDQGGLGAGVVKIERRQILLDGLADVDRALALALRTGLEGRVHLGPMGRAMVGVIAPMGCLAGLAGHRGTGQQGGGEARRHIEEVRIVMVRSPGKWPNKQKRPKCTSGNHLF